MENTEYRNIFILSSCLLSFSLSLSQRERKMMT